MSGTVFSGKKYDKEAQNEYLDFLRTLLKDKSYVKLAYMTGILPVKKYGTHSALNMFDEYSMTDSGILAEYAGFTEQDGMGINYDKKTKKHQCMIEKCMA